MTQNIFPRKKNGELWTDEHLINLARAVIEGGDLIAATRLTGYTRDSVRNGFDKLRKRWPTWFPLLSQSVNKPNWAKGFSPFPPEDDRYLAYTGKIGGPPIPPAAVPPDGFEIIQNSGQYDSSGNLERQYIKTRKENGSVYDVPEDHVVKGESAFVDADGRTIAKWVKTAKKAEGSFSVEEMRQAFAEFEGASPFIEVPNFCEDDIMTTYPLADLHMGLLSWSPETGENYDVKIATEQMTKGVIDLVQQSRPSKRATIIFLGDFYHSNDAKAVTPGSGHKLDVDGRWPRVFLAGAKLALSLIDIVARKHEDVEVVCLPGNHDTDSAVCLAVALSLYFSNNPHIRVSTNQQIAWYTRFGKVLLGATHGHTMGFDRMASMMAVDRPSDWGLSQFRYFLTGHIHQDKVREIATVRVESFASPAAKDAWTASAGYRSMRALNAITYHKDRGEIGRHRVSVGLPTE